ncbi:MAG: ATP-binding protein [Kribbellaceae bacterium]|nr:ATP-binding protein [Kribbellaceae bacterium]
MTAPPIDLLADYPEAQLDPHWIEDNKRAAEKSLARVPVRYSTATVTTSEVAAWVRTLVSAAVRDARAFNPKVQRGPSLLLLGPVGTGKTHQVYGAIREIVHTGVSCSWLVTTAADLYADLRPNQNRNDQVFDRFANVPLLVLDDLGAHKGTEWTAEQTFRLINHRYENELATVVTSNLTAPQLRDRVGDRITSRLVEMCRHVALKGSDRRRQQTELPIS